VVAVVSKKAKFEFNKEEVFTETDALDFAKQIVGKQQSHYSKLKDS